jgi:hypothetical protein
MYRLHLQVGGQVKDAAYKLLVSCLAYSSLETLYRITRHYDPDPIYTFGLQNLIEFKCELLLIMLEEVMHSSFL